MTIEDVVKLLGLVPLPDEGGLFRETYRAAHDVAQEALPVGYAGSRSLGTAIYYLLTPELFSAIHRVRGDEIFHFYLGDPVEMLHLRSDGSGERLVLGNDLANGMRPQILVPAGLWQGAKLRDGGRFALAGATMSPGFDSGDFELGRRPALIERYPAFSREIVELTRS